MIKLIQEFNRQICQLFRNDSFSFSFAVLFVAYLLMVLPRTYGVNDNVGILFEATGGFISEFTSFFYMKLLHLLYHRSNDIPWYGLTLYFAHILSLFIFVRSLARIKKL
ncbi:membrane protein [Beggiatoa sp. PS]|nr:membrane protein [Beggiatoa sp. PS]